MSRCAPGRAVRRYSQDTQERDAVARVLSAGALPPGAEPEEWVGRLRVARYRLQSDRTAAWGFSGLLAALVAAAAVRSAGPDVGVWLYAAALLVAGVVLGIRRHRRLRTAERLAAELEERLAHACGGEPAGPLQVEGPRPSQPSQARAEPPGEASLRAEGAGGPSTSMGRSPGRRLLTLVSGREDAPTP